MFMQVQETNVELEDGKVNRLQYLLKQAEIYSHFVTSGFKASKANKVGKRKALAPIDVDNATPGK